MTSVAKAKRGTQGEALAKAEAAWGMNMPDWVRELAVQCDSSSQASVARRIDQSNTVVSRALGNTYAGNLNKLAERVRGHFLAKEVVCPVLETIPRQRCITEQEKPLSMESPQRVQLYRACRKGCPHFIARESK